MNVWWRVHGYVPWCMYPYNECMVVCGSIIRIVIYLIIGSYLRYSHCLYPLLGHIFSNQ